MLTLIYFSYFHRNEGAISCQRLVVYICTVNEERKNVKAMFLLCLFVYLYLHFN